MESEQYYRRLAKQEYGNVVKSMSGWIGDIAARVEDSVMPGTDDLYTELRDPSEMSDDDAVVDKAESILNENIPQVEEDVQDVKSELKDLINEAE